MFAVIFLFEAASGNSLLGFMPESIGLLILGVVMIAFAVVLRRFFDRSEARENFHQTAANVHRTN